MKKEKLQHCHQDHGHEHKETPKSVPANDSGAIYNCPMHPQVRQKGPGNCPICGMALEPEVVTGEEGPSPELADMTRRLWIGFLITIPVLVLEMGAPA